MRSAILTLWLLAFSPAASGQADQFSALRFLLGDWTAIETPAGESGSFAFRLSVQDRVLLRTNQAQYAASADRPASLHEDLMVIYNDQGILRADYFDNEGHVIRYSARADTANTVTFVSDRQAQQPRYRLSYRVGPDGILIGSFEIAPPDSPDDFKPYLSWKARRR